MHRSVESKRPQIAALCRQYGVRQLEIFGSAARSTDFDPARSDIDFLVQFDRQGEFDPLDQFFGLQSALSVLLGRPIDLVEPLAIRNPYILQDIESGRELVYAA